MNFDLVLESLRDALLLPEIESRPVPIDERFVQIPPERLREAVAVLVNNLELRHLSTITGQDTGQGIELLYHFWHGNGLTLCTTVPYEKPTVDTLMALIPAAAFYEAEVTEMLGVTFVGNADPGPLFLPDDWDGDPPLRKQNAHG